jgi:RNA polymerase sigma-70 factor (ECF subfamily)
VHLFKQLFLSIVGHKKTKATQEHKLITDEELVKQLVATNNTLLFSELYDRFAKKIYNKCYGFVKNEDEAKDVTQDVFLKLYMKLGSFKGDAKFSTWLYSFTYNFCVNYVNRDKGKKMSDQSDTLENHEYYLNTTEEIDDAQLFEIKIEKLERALNLIEPEDKAILLLKYQDDVSVKELQSVLGAGESAIKMRLKRAKIKVIEVHKQLD